MEEWQNGHDQPGYHYHQEQERKPVETPGKRFWKMWGPLLIKWGIGIGVGMAVMAAMMMAYMKTHYQTQAALWHLCITGTERKRRQPVSYRIRKRRYGNIRQ